jgi:hypothetical protein
MAMKNLVLTTLLCGSVAQLGGCIIVGDDDGDPPPTPPDANEPPPDAEPPPPPGPGAFLVTWTLLGGDVVEGVQAEVTCPPDAPDIRITADPDPAVDGDEDIYLYECGLGGGPADKLPPGTYDVWVELLDADGTLVAQSDIEEGLVLDFDDALPLDFEFSVDAGKFAFTWTITDGGAPSTCEAIGAEDVGLLLTVAGTTFADDFLFSCEAGQGVTDPLPIADAYVGDIDLLDNSTSPPTVLGSADAANMTLDYGNHFNDLGNFVFAVP